jgi:hypothetical protein
VPLDYDAVVLDDLKFQPDSRQTLAHRDHIAEIVDSVISSGTLATPSDDSEITNISDCLIAAALTRKTTLLGVEASSARVPAYNRSWKMRAFQSEICRAWVNAFICGSLETTAARQSVRSCQCGCGVLGTRRIVRRLISARYIFSLFSAA